MTKLDKQLVESHPSDGVDGAREFIDGIRETLKSLEEHEEYSTVKERRTAASKNIKQAKDLIRAITNMDDFDQGLVDTLTVKISEDLQEKDEEIKKLTERLYTSRRCGGKREKVAAGNIQYAKLEETLKGMEATMKDMGAKHQEQTDAMEAEIAAMKREHEKAIAVKETEMSDMSMLKQSSIERMEAQIAAMEREHKAEMVAAIAKQERPAKKQ